MNKNVLGVLVAVVALALIGGVVVINNQNNNDMSTMSAGSSSTEQDGNVFTNPNKDQSSSEVQTGEVKMDIAGFAYAQKSLTIKKGTTVTWTNTDSARHDVAPDEDSPNFMGSELLSEGESYSYTFDTVGTYAYHCTPHPYMKAMVKVVE